MAKYIIDIPYDTTCINALKYEDSKCVAAMSYIIPDLTPYTEPDEDEIRQKAHEEAWEFAKTVSIMKPEDKRECWGTDKYNTINLGYSYQEAKDKYESWKAEKDKVCVGDEVKEINGIWKGIVMNIDDTDDLTIMVSSGQSCNGYKKKYFRKTGRHFNEIEELLKKMRDAE